MSAPNQNQPGLVASHAQYVKGAAEVSIFRLPYDPNLPCTCSNTVNRTPSATNLMDRPLAMSGIAAVLGRQPDLAGTYLAGSWKDQLPRQLLWEITEDVQPRPTAYRAPSWSWAAVDGPISFLDHVPSSSPDSTLEIVDTANILEDPVVPFGAVSPGSSITVRGRIVPKLVVDGGKALVDIGYSEAGLFNSQDEPAFQPKSTPWRPWGAYGPMPLIHPDAIDELTYGTTLHCLEIYPFDVKSNNGPYGLILVRNLDTGGGGFRRVGSFRFYPSVPRARLVSFRANRPCTIPSIDLFHAGFLQ